MKATLGPGSRSVKYIKSSKLGCDSILYVLVRESF